MSDALVFRQSMSIGLRWFAAAAALFCFFPAYDLLIRPGVPVLALGMVPMWLISLAAGALGLFLLAAAILGPARTVIFDPATRELRDHGAADFGLRWSRRYPFRDLGAPTVERVCETDGPDSWRVAIPCAGRERPLGIESYQEEAAAQEAANRIAVAIALNQNDEEARGIFLAAMGEHDAALEQFEIARRHNPFEFNWVAACRGIALFSARRYQDAIDTLIQLPEPNIEVRCWLAASYAKAGRIDEARATLAKFLAEAERDMPDFPGRSLERWKPHLRGFKEYRDACDSEHLFGALAAAGLE